MSHQLRGCLKSRLVHDGLPAALQVRLMLVLAPAACCLAGVALHEALAALFKGVHASPKEQESKPPKEDAKAKKPSKPTKVRNHRCIYGTMHAVVTRAVILTNPDEIVTELPARAGKLLVHRAWVLGDWPAHPEGRSLGGTGWPGVCGGLLHMAQHLGQRRNVFCPLHCDADPWGRRQHPHL